MYVVAAILLLVAAGALVWFCYFQTYHLLTVQDGVLYRTGNRGMREFKNSLRACGARTVVCVVDDNELADPAKPMFAAEQRYLERSGVRFVHLPVTLGGWPTTDDVRKFLAIVEDKDNRPVLVHCAQGVRRTGMFVAAFERSVLGWDAEKCRANMQAFGHSARTTRDVEKFIDTYDGATRSLTAELAPTGQE
jgi:uncharacterized protein (TIGR01244 family)